MRFFTFDELIKFVFLHLDNLNTCVLYKSFKGENPPHISPYSVEYPTANSDLFPVANKIDLNLLEIAISMLP